jgi:hypothetical protein
MQDGYVVGEWDPQTQVRVSYPKFQTAGGQYVSVKYGIWDDGARTYVDSTFTFLNVPILKCHGYQYGVTASLKHHVGTMTTALSTNTHAAVGYGALGSFLSTVRMPDLNILDCIYVLAHPDAGPWCTYEEATRLDKLAAGCDPVALDLWATVNILVPALIANGHTQYPMQDPEDPGSIFRIYLDLATDVLLAAGIEVTNDIGQIDGHVCGESAVDTDQRAVRPDQTIQARPNPSSANTAIRFTMERAGTVRLDVHDASGRRVWSTTKAVSARRHQELQWSGCDLAGRKVAAGTYYYTLSGAGEPLTGAIRILR